MNIVSQLKLCLEGHLERNPGGHFPCVLLSAGLQQRRGEVVGRFELEQRLRRERDALLGVDDDLGGVHLLLEEVLHPDTAESVAEEVPLQKLTEHTKCLDQNEKAKVKKEVSSKHICESS